MLKLAVNKSMCMSDNEQGINKLRPNGHNNFVDKCFIKELSIKRLIVLKNLNNSKKEQNFNKELMKQQKVSRIILQKLEVSETATGVCFII